MRSTQHHYSLRVIWRGNEGTGTSGYKDFERSHSICIDNKVEIQGSSDPAFRGDPTKHNPEELFLAAISSCHMLWYLHLCAISGIVVTTYCDEAMGTMTETENGSGKFTEVVLQPTVTITNPLLIEKAQALHEKANALCFIANSLNLPVKHHPTCLTEKT